MQHDDRSYMYSAAQTSRDIKKHIQQQEEQASWSQSGMLRKKNLEKRCAGVPRRIYDLIVSVSDCRPRKLKLKFQYVAYRHEESQSFSLGKKANKLKCRTIKSKWLHQSLINLIWSKR